MRNFSRKSQEIFFKWSWSLKFLVTKYPLANDSEFHQILNLKLLFECIPKVHSSSCILQSLFCNEPINIKLEEKLKIWKRKIISVVFSTNIFGPKYKFDLVSDYTFWTKFWRIAVIFGPICHFTRFWTIFGYFEPKWSILPLFRINFGPNSIEFFFGFDEFWLKMGFISTLFSG